MSEQNSCMAVLGVLNRAIEDMTQASVDAERLQAEAVAARLKAESALSQLNAAQQRVEDAYFDLRNQSPPGSYWRVEIECGLAPATRAA